MKLNAALAKSLLMAASIGMVVPLTAQTPYKPAKPVKPAPAPAEAPPKIEGLELPRKNGGFVGITVDGVTMVMKFYDSEKKPAAIDVARATARWNPINRNAEVRAVLNPGPDGKALVSPQVVQPPLAFRVYLTLFDADGNPVESLVADLKKLNEPKP